MNTSELVNAAQSGDANAFGRLVDHYYGLVFVTAFGIVKDAEAARDLTQDAFATAWSRLSSIRNPKAFGLWVRRIGRNLCLNWVKSEQYRAHLLNRHGPPLVPSDESSPAETLEQEERKRAVMKSLESLSPRLRAAIVAYYLEEQSIPRAAETLGVTANTMKKRLSRAREKLRVHFESEVDSELAREFSGPNKQTRREDMRKALALGPAFPALSDRVGVESLPSGTAVTVARLGGLARRWPVLSAAFVTTALVVGVVLVWRTTPSPSPGGTEAGSVPDASTQVASVRTAPSLLPNSSSSDDESAETEAINSMTETSDAAPQTFEIEGQVTDAAGNTVAGATVRLVVKPIMPTANGLRQDDHEYRSGVRQYHPDNVFETFTGPDGGYRFEISPKLEPSALYSIATIIAEKGTAISGRGSVKLEAGETQRRDPVLESDTPLFTWRGALIDPHGNPVPDAVLSFVAVRGQTSLFARTDDLGNFEFLVEEEDLANLAVHSPSLGATLIQAVPVASGEVTKLQWPEGASVSGRLGGPDGSPLPGVEVLVTGDYHLRARQGGILGIGHAASTVTGEDGRFRFDAIPAPLDVSIQVFQSHEVPMSPVTNFGDLAPGDAVEWNHTLYAPAVVSGVAMGIVHNRPVPNIFLSALKDGEPVVGSTVETDAAGRFEMRLLAGNGVYTIYPHLRVPKENLQYAVYGDDVVIAAGEEREVELRIAEPVTVRLRVTDALKNGVKASIQPRFVLYNEKGEESLWSSTSAWMETDDAGRLEWIPVMPGQEFRLDIDGGKEFLEVYTDRYVGGPGEVFDVSVELSRPSILGARVVDESGEELANRLLRVEIELAGLRHTSVRTGTDSRGGFSIAGEVPAAECVLTIYTASDETLSSGPINYDGRGVESMDLGTVVLLPLEHDPTL